MPLILSSSLTGSLLSDITLQVGALITMGCVLSIDPKVDEVITAVEKDAVPSLIINTNITPDPEECDDFEEGYSDDEMFTANEGSNKMCKENENTHYFRSWILDICFKNMGWIFKGNEVCVSTYFFGNSSLIVNAHDILSMR